MCPKGLTDKRDRFVKQAGFIVLLVLLFNILIACGAGHDAETQVPTKPDIHSVLSDPSVPEGFES